MHAAFPRFSDDLASILRLVQGDVLKVAEHAGGALLSKVIALALETGFALAFAIPLLDNKRAKELEARFEDIFVIRDPSQPAGKRFYQGRFLLRTKKPGDELNVRFDFCPDPEELFKPSMALLGRRALNGDAIVKAKALTDAETDALLLSNPGAVDLVISFKDIPAILGLIKRPNADIVGLLLENLVQITGNAGHMFKLGALAKGIEQTVAFGKG